MLPKTHTKFLDFDRNFGPDLRKLAGFAFHLLLVLI